MRPGYSARLNHRFDILHAVPEGGVWSWSPDAKTQPSLVGHTARSDDGPVVASSAGGSTELRRNLGLVPGRIRGVGIDPSLS